MKSRIIQFQSDYYWKKQIKSTKLIVFVRKFIKKSKNMKVKTLKKISKISKVSVFVEPYLFKKINDMWALIMLNFMIFLQLIE